MALVDLHLGQQKADGLGRAGDRVDPVPRPRRVAGRAFHRDEDVDTSAVAERDLEPGPAQHRHVRAHARALNDAPDGVMLAGLARQAAGEDELAGERGLARDHGLHGVQHGGEVRLLLARPFPHHAFAGQVELRAVDDVAGIGVRHGRGGLVHGIADEHQRFAARSRPVGRDQVSHRVVADVGEAHRAQARLDRGPDEGFEQRLLFQELGLRTRHLDQLDQQFFGALAGNAGVEQLLNLGLIHGRLPSDVVEIRTDGPVDATSPLPACARTRAYPRSLHTSLARGGGRPPNLPPPLIPFRRNRPCPQVTSAPPWPSRFFTPGHSTNTRHNAKMLADRGRRKKTE